MIIDANEYKRVCKCGKCHEMTTKACIIDSKCINDAENLIEKYGIFGKSVAVYDENTYRAVGGALAFADYEVILSPDNLHADEHGVKQLSERLPEDYDYLIAVGSGTVHDITRFCAYEADKPFVSVPTAASVDGFCSSVAAMTWKGYKKTFTAKAPTLVIADLDIISKAPMRLTKSGFGDMIGKYIALADWKIANLIVGEYFCDYIYSMTFDATQAVLASAKGIARGDKDSYGKLTYGLLMSGLAMQLLGNSRCASGAEHHISHLIEMRPIGLGAESSALHGEKVGVGTLLCARKYHQTLENPKLCYDDYEPAEKEYIEKMFGNGLTASIIEENRVDACFGIKGEAINSKLEQIKKIVNEIPNAEALEEIYRELGVIGTLSEIGVPEELSDTLLEYSPLVRNRLTLMRLSRAIKENTDKI